MFKEYKREKSYFISGLSHIILLALFFFISFSPDYSDEEYVTIGFGTFGELSSAGVKSPKPEKIIQPQKIEKEEEKIEEPEEEIVELPKTENEDDENLIVQETDEKEIEEEPEPEVISEESVEEETSNDGIAETGLGQGNFGFEISFGGEGTRKIYSYNLPEYPRGVSKEIDVKLRFTILPDGTVGRIIPLMKADTQLENAAINSLRKWRFEPLPRTQEQLEQTAIITFPYRLR